VIGADGAPVGPVTALAAASDYAVATRGARVDLWVAHERTLSWAPARCALSLER
jgi:hypothetical protein